MKFATRLTILAYTALLSLPSLAHAEADAEPNDEPPKLLTKIDIPLPSPPAIDTDENCPQWASQGECDTNPDYMLKECAKSCGVTPQQHIGDARVYEGEDAAIGAFRFAENYSGYYPNGMIGSDVVLDIARDLTDKIPSDYVVPEDITHCGDTKRKVCSAGKLWKRAEELRKDDMHDAAGADLIRAMLKTGIEVDFVERCERSLQWAFGSITRQREREKRAAAEEAKLEKRRQEEAEAMAEAAERKKEYEANFYKFGESLIASLGTQEAAVGADGTAEISPETQQLLRSVIQTYVSSGPHGGNCTEALQLLKKIPQSDKSVDILLVEARCHEMEGSYKLALSAAGKLIAKAANYDPWLDDSPRMMATVMGSNAAMQLGLSENAISFYQNVLKFDPEQSRARKQYKGLKKVVKLLNKADEQIKKGYNKAASEFVDECLSAMRGLDVDSPLFRSNIQLKQCTILSGMGKYEEALENCDIAVELRLANADVVSVQGRKEAHLARAEALLLDMDYDEAVVDLRAAFDLVPDDDQTGEKRELHQRLQQAMHQKNMWNGGEKDHRFNENTGYPDGRPPERDHAKILQLPIDLEHRSKEVKCAWLKKQFKALVRHYHPDKYKGNKKRAARKFKEVKEAKEIISSQWNC
jgi:tetratricopeptide (TPR) repeat protein